MTAELEGIGSLDAVSSTSALQFKDNRGLLRDVAQALQADMLLEATVTKEGDGIRVHARISASAIDQKFWVDDSFVGHDMDEMKRCIGEKVTNTPWYKMV